MRISQTCFTCEYNALKNILRDPRTRGIFIGNNPNKTAMLNGPVEFSWRP